MRANFVRVERASNNLLGLLLLPLLVFGLASGVAIWALAGLATLAPVALISVHAYAGLLSLPVLAAKLWAGLSSLRRRARREDLRPSSARTALTLGLLLSTLGLYGSGIMMYANFTPGGNALYKQLHLWSVMAAVPFITHHLYLHLRRALQTVGRTVYSPPPGAVTLTRGRVLGLVGLVLVTAGGVRGTGRILESLGSDDPNDFPVTLTSGGADDVDDRQWRLLVSGDVRRPLEFSLDDLEGATLDRSEYSLDCVLGWSVVREWGGIPVMDVIEKARPRSGMVSAVFRSTTGYEVALPREVIEDRRTMVTLEVGGVPLAPEHGFPARLMAPGVIGEKCVKWLAEIEVITRK